MAKRTAAKMRRFLWQLIILTISIVDWSRTIVFMREPDDEV